MRISIIAAVAQNRVIGKGDRIPWHIREDLIRFKTLTLGKTVIMGRGTFDSLLGYYKRSGRPIPQRNHIIVTRDLSYSVNVPDCFVVSSIDNAISKAKEIEQAEVFISGGAQIFEQTIDKADRLYLTVVKGNFEGDTYFPDYSQFSKVIEKEEKESEGHTYTFMTLEKE